MRPLLRKFTRAIDELIEAFPLIRTETRKYNEVMCRYEYIDKVELQQAKCLYDTSDMALINFTGRSGLVECLRRYCDTACFPLR